VEVHRGAIRSSPDAELGATVDHRGVETLSRYGQRQISGFANRREAGRLLARKSSAITERRYIHLFDRPRTDEAVREAMASATG
jgi:hypothetical protein